MGGLVLGGRVGEGGARLKLGEGVEEEVAWLLFVN